ncbi:MAG: hypothetical protein P4M08_10870 [Oligoflexia bacterium]|nr:hypothetical protein [Oligoflexia bacterium]
MTKSLTIVSGLCAFSVPLYGISLAHAAQGVGYNGQCPELAGHYLSAADRAPMVILESHQYDPDIVYYYGDGSGPYEVMIADGYGHTLADGTMETITCSPGVLTKSFSVNGFTGQQIFELLSNGDILVDGQLYKRAGK